MLEHLPDPSTKGSTKGGRPKPPASKHQASSSKHQASSIKKLVRVSIGPKNLRNLRVSEKFASFLRPVMGVGFHSFAPNQILPDFPAFVDFLDDQNVGGEERRSRLKREFVASARAAG